MNYDSRSPANSSRRRPTIRRYPHAAAHDPGHGDGPVRANSVHQILVDEVWGPEVAPAFEATLGEPFDLRQEALEWLWHEDLIAALTT
jgi:hypothetical protein